MKTKSEFTIIERAIQTIDGFSAVDKRIRQHSRWFYGNLFACVLETLRTFGYSQSAHTLLGAGSRHHPGRTTPENNKRWGLPVSRRAA